MADIELVIKMPEEIYKDIQSHDWKNGERWYSEEWRAIHSGTPLPKGHGRLIDADVLGEKLHRYTDAPYQYALSVFNESPTIIEADKRKRVSMNIGDRVKFKTIGGWYNSGIIRDINEDSYLIEVDKSEDIQISFPYYLRVLSSCEIISEKLVAQESEGKEVK